MKKVCTTALALLLGLSLTACSAAAPAPEATASAIEAETDMKATVDTDATADTDATTDTDATAAADATTDTDAAADAKSAYAVTYPVTVTDQLGRSVTIEKVPETIVSGYYISTSLLIALNQTQKLVGVEAKADKRSIYQLSAPALTGLPSVGTAKDFDLEGCAALAPDLVILPAKLKEVIPSLEELGIPVLAVNPEDDARLAEMIQLLGQATDSMETAQALLDYSTEQLTFLEMLKAGMTEAAPSVYLAGNSSLLSTAGPAMYQNSLITNAGGKNVAEGLTDSYWAEISYEQLLAWNPDYIILAADADYTVADVLQDSALAECDAVKNSHVYQLPNAIEAWDSPVPGSILGSLWLAHILQPERYPSADFEQAVADFYETFYRFTPDVQDLFG